MHLKSHSTLSLMLIIILVIAALLPVGSLGMYAYRIGSHSIQELAEANNASMAGTTAELVSRIMKQNINLAKGFADLPSLVNAVSQHQEAQTRTQLGVLVNSNPRIVRAFVTDRAGLLWSDYPEATESLGKTFSYRDWYKGVSRHWQAYVSEVYQRHAEPKVLVVTIAAPIRGTTGKTAGILAYQIRLEGLTSWLKQVTLGKSGFAFLIDHTGTVAAHPLLDLQNRTYNEYAGLDAVQSALEGKESVTQYLDPFTGKHMIATIMPVPLPDQRWAVVAQQPVNEAFAPIQQMGLQISIAGSILAVAAIAVVVSIGWRNAHNRRLKEEVTVRNQELKRLTSQLASTNKELESFSYSVSHDLRAPLRAIDGFSQALMEDCHDKLDTTEQDHLNRIRAACRKMEQLINDLLKLSRITRNEMHHEHVDLSALARDIIKTLKANQPDRQATFAIPNTMHAYGDHDLLRVALENLLENAWKFTAGRDHTHIEIGIENIDGSQAYYIKDNGAGFNQRYAEKMFNAFQRLHRQEEFHGTGIGLATVKRIIQLHGGHIWAKGHEGEGAVFYFTLHD